ncbi:DUF4352 domain-containing protein [Brevibacillus laterosporus]|uniref:DUF4352 domain-containing protein n=1 Tax=Brevibacillus laterosporus TaxID=1465 RepID=UPI00215BF149|nr:DUF4352 domain-containing protein [Brevibacillus laterosporus]MCR8994558.1 DUF4352 domain-containing protein [Brevibacillus laterosporus]
MKKKMIGSALALTCVLSGVSVMPTFAEANHLKQAVATSIKSTVTPQGLINPMESRKPIKKNKLTNTEMIDKFYVNPGFGWVKVFVENKGSKPITVVVTDENDNEKMSGKVKPGKTWTGYGEKPWGVGDYKLSFTSSQAEMKGTYSVRIANTADELDD